MTDERLPSIPPFREEAVAGAKSIFRSGNAIIRAPDRLQIKPVNNVPFYPIFINFDISSKHKKNEMDFVSADPLTIAVNIIPIPIINIAFVDYKFARDDIFSYGLDLCITGFGELNNYIINVQYNIFGRKIDD